VFIENLEFFGKWFFHRLPLVATLKKTMKELNDNIRDLSTDFLEVAIDTFITNEVIKEIPILGSLIKFAIITNSISERLFLKKLDLFLKEFDKQSGDKKLQLLKKLEEPEEKQKIGENLLLLIDKFDEFEKPKILAKIFASYLAENINQTEFFRIGRAINLAFISDLKSVIDLEESNLSQDILDNILSSGFSEISKQSLDTGGGISYISLKLSEIGKTFQKIMK